MGYDMGSKIQGRINRLKKEWEKDLEDDEDDDVTFDRRQKEPRNDSQIKKCHVLVIYFLKDGPKACARVTLSKHLHRFLVVFSGLRVFSGMHTLTTSYMRYI